MNYKEMERIKESARMAVIDAVFLDASRRMNETGTLLDDPDSKWSLALELYDREIERLQDSKQELFKKMLERYPEIGD